MKHPFPTNQDQPATLHRLRAGQCAHVSDMNAIHKTIQQRLIDLGVSEGTLIKLVRASLFGGPLMLEANGQLFGLRRGDAARIGVRAV